MITQEHLDHWLSEIKHQLNGLSNEISIKKLKDKTGVTVAVSPNIDQDVFVSFEYLREKADTIKQLVKNIEFDIIVDAETKNNEIHDQDLDTHGD